MSDMPGRDKEFEDYELLTAIKGHDEPVAAAKDVAPELGVSTKAVNNRLRQLKGEGIVTRKKVGSGQVWWLRPGDDS